MKRTTFSAILFAVTLAGCGGRGTGVGLTNSEVRHLGQNAVRSLRVPIAWMEFLPTAGVPARGENCLPGMPQPLQPGSLNQLLELGIGELEKVDLFHDEGQTLPAGFISFLRTTVEGIEVPAFQTTLAVEGDHGLSGNLLLLGVPGTGDYEMKGTLVHANRGQIEIDLRQVQGHPHGMIKYSDPSGFTVESSMSITTEGDLAVNLATSLGIGGQFLIKNDCSGTGTLVHRGTQIGTLNWNREGIGSIAFPDGTSLALNTNSGL